MAQNTGYSWKKPWLFRDMDSMRRTLTSPEAYRKLRYLERHSAFEKPYLFDHHQQNQLIYQGPGFRYPPYEKPSGAGGRPNSRCAQMACQGGILTCGGCEPILCICAIPLVGCRIVIDPTGQAYIVPQGSRQTPQAVSIVAPLVCLPKDANIQQGKYYEIWVECTDAVGNTANAYVYPVGCPQGCCGQFQLSGADTTNPGVDYTCAVQPVCADVTCSVSSLDSCTGLTCSVGGGGASITVSVPALACGSFVITATRAAIPANNCPALYATKTVRINNTGQGGAWNLDSYQTKSGTGDCSFGTQIYPCTVEQYRYADDPGDVGAGCDNSNANFAVVSGNPTVCSMTGGAFPCGYYDTVCDTEHWPDRQCRYGWCKWIWSCVCP